MECENVMIYHFKGETKGTHRNRPKSAPYLRLNNSKRTSKCQSILFYSTRKIFEKSLKMPKTLEAGNHYAFSTSILSQSSKKNWRATLWEIFLSEKCLGMPKKPFSLARYCMIPGQKENLFGSVPWATRYTIQDFIKLLVELFWSLQVYRKKHWRKGMTKEPTKNSITPTDGSPSVDEDWPDSVVVVADIGQHRNQTQHTHYEQHSWPEHYTNTQSKLPQSNSQTFSCKILQDQTLSSKIPARIMHCLPRSWKWNLTHSCRKCIEVRLG